MLPITSEALELVLESAPDFVARVQRAQSKKRHRSVRITLDRFYDDPIRLYACLWYAVASGVTVVLASRSSSLPVSVPPETLTP